MISTSVLKTPGLKKPLALLFKFSFAPNPTASVGETKWCIRVLDLDTATLACRRQRPLALFVIRKDPNDQLCSFFQNPICSESNRSIGNANVHARGYAQGAAGAPIFTGDSLSQEPHLLPSPLTILRIQIQRLPNSSAQRTTTLHAASLPISWPTCMHALLADLHGIRLGDSWPTPAHHSNVRGETADPGDSNRNPGKTTEKTSSFVVSCQQNFLTIYGMWPPLKSLWHRCSRPSGPGCDDKLQHARSMHCAPPVVTVASAAASRCALEWRLHGATKIRELVPKQPSEKIYQKSTALAEKGLL